jgi:hypothetical protein
MGKEGRGMSETDKIIKELLDGAFLDYVGRNFQELFQDFAPVIDDKDFAKLCINALIKVSIECGAMAEGSIMHRLGLALMDYIARK